MLDVQMNVDWLVLNVPRCWAPTEHLFHPAVAKPADVLNKIITFFVDWVYRVDLVMLHISNNYFSIFYAFLNLHHVEFFFNLVCWFLFFSIYLLVLRVHYESPIVSEIHLRISSKMEANEQVVFGDCLGEAGNVLVLKPAERNIEVNKFRVWFWKELSKVLNHGLIITSNSIKGKVKNF